MSAEIRGLMNDANRVGFARLAAEHHRAQTDRRDFDTSFAEIAVFHERIAFVERGRE
jgi:hypothetical protein